jgi:hypothetical protein
MSSTDDGMQTYNASIEQDFIVFTSLCQGSGRRVGETSAGCMLVMWGLRGSRERLPGVAVGVAQGEAPSERMARHVAQREEVSD